QERIGRVDVVLAREEQRHVDRNPGEDRLFDGGQPLPSAGKLDEKVRGAGRACRALAAASVLAVSCASRGETSSDTQPSTPAVRSQIGRNRSAARVRSSSASSKKSSSPALPCWTF